MKPSDQNPVRPLALAAGLLAAAACLPAMAAERFDCGDASAGISVVISVSPEVGVGDFEGLGRSGLLSPDGQGAWVNPESGIRFLPEQLPPALFLGSEQFSCTNMAAAAAGSGAVASQSGQTGDQAPAAPANTDVVINLPGRSLGGNLRSGPGIDGESLGSVAENTPLTIVANTGVDFDGYDWFVVQLRDGRSGFQWGGILCSEGTQVAGVYQACGLEPTN